MTVMVIVMKITAALPTRIVYKVASMNWRAYWEMRVNSNAHRQFLLMVDKGLLKAKNGWDLSYIEGGNESNGKGFLVVLDGREATMGPE